MEICRKNFSALWLRLHLFRSVWILHALVILDVLGLLQSVIELILGYSKTHLPRSLCWRPLLATSDQWFDKLCGQLLNVRASFALLPSVCCCIRVSLCQQELLVACGWALQIHLRIFIVQYWLAFYQALVLWLLLFWLHIQVS